MADLDDFLTDLHSDEPSEADYEPFEYDYDDDALWWMDGDDAGDDRPSTHAEAMREYAWNVGRERRDLEWISTPYDTWERNPFYDGEPGPHPEDWSRCDGEEEPVDPVEPVVAPPFPDDDDDSQGTMEWDDLPF
jgi:hypothetical protein